MSKRVLLDYTVSHYCMSKKIKKPCLVTLCLVSITLVLIA